MTPHSRNILGDDWVRLRGEDIGLTEIWYFITARKLCGSEKLGVSTDIYKVREHGEFFDYW